MEEGNVCTFCKRSFFNGNLLDVHMTEHLGLRLGIEKHNIEHDQVGIIRGKGVALDKKVIKKEIKLEGDDEKVIKKEIKSEVDEDYGVKSCGLNQNPKKYRAEVDKKVIKKEIKLEVDEKVIKKEIKLEVDEDYGAKSRAWVSSSHPTVKHELISDLICKQCGKELHSSSDLASHMKTHLHKRKRSIGTNSDDEVKKGALSLIMLSENRTDLYLDGDKVVHIYVDGVKKESNDESGPGQTSMVRVNKSLRSNDHDNQSGTVLREPKTYKCQTCSKEFSTFQGLGGHMKIHKQTP